jgi:hypothetical protein
MRPLTILLVLILVAATLGAAGLGPAPALAADSISRDARGAQPTGMYAPLGSPPSPGLYLLNQTTIFIVGVGLLVLAAALGAYTMAVARRAGRR